VSVPCVITDAVYTRRWQQFVDALRGLQHDVKGHILRAHVGDLLSPEVGQILDSRDRIDHGVNRYLTGGIAGLRAGRGGSGNRSAGRQNDDVSLALAEGILVTGAENDGEEECRDRVRPLHDTLRCAYTFSARFANCRKSICERPGQLKSLEFDVDQSVGSQLDPSEGYGRT